MEESFGPDFVTITDEDGNDIELELIDMLEHNGQTYIAFFPALDEEDEEDEEDEADSEELGLIILKRIMEDGEEILSTPDSDEELNEVYELFMEQLFEDEDE